MLERGDLGLPLAGCLLHSHISLPDAGHPVGSASPCLEPTRGIIYYLKPDLLRLKDPQVGTSLGTLILGVSHPQTRSGLLKTSGCFPLGVEAKYTHRKRGNIKKASKE